MHKRNFILTCLTAITCLIPGVGSSLTASADSYNEETERFVSEMFSNATPQLNALWLSPAARTGLSEILGHAPRSLRIKYRQVTDQTLWIFDEIGKVKPITIGVFIQDGKISTIRVLKFRESRGWEIKYSFFTDQFQHIGLTQQLQLTAPIDGITGATLSVGAMKRVARAALFLDNSLHEIATSPPTLPVISRVRQN
jgi:hypothetical protein